MPSLLEALEQKYGLGVNFNIEEESLVSIYVPKLPPLLCVPELLVLNDCNIDCAGESNELKEKCRTVKELDLAQNNLRDWNEVFHILQHMPRIEFLNLSKNRFSGPLSSISTFTMNSLKNVVLNGTCLDWFSIEMLLKCLPVLEELHLSLNDYQNVLIDTIELDEAIVSKHIDGEENDMYKLIRTPTTKTIYSAKLDSTEGTATCKSANLESSSYKKVSAHKGVRKLHFNGNPVEDWKEICRLGRVFPNLETLVLAECPLRSIQPVTCRETEEISVDEADIAESPHKYFRNLTFLNLSSANINTWDDIDRLSKFPSLKNLRVQNLPLWDKCESTDHERRQLLIARLPFLRTLNGGGIITMDEREDAERAFIRYYMARPENERPLRYNELISKHGKLDPLINIDLKPEKRVKVNFVHGTFTEERFVDVYRTVSDLKSRLEKLISLPAKNMRLFYSDQDLKNLQGPEEMKFPNKQLYSYNIRSGDEILIVPKNC